MGRDGWPALTTLCGCFFSPAGVVYGAARQESQALAPSSIPEVTLLTTSHPHTNLGHAPTVTEPACPRLVQSPNQHARGSYSHRTSMPEVRQSPNQHARGSTVSEPACPRFVQSPNQHARGATVTEPACPRSDSLRTSMPEVATNERGATILKLQFLYFIGID
eukprot:gene10783-biopygen15361